MRIALIGGHMAPALGFLSVLPKEIEVVYVGRKHVFEGDAGTSLEYETLKKKGVKFIPFSTGRVQRNLTKHTLSSLAKIPKGFFSALFLLRREKPDVVVGFGGYMSVPLGVAAKFLRIPLVIHESTLHAGLANKILAPIADKICISWDSNRAYFPKEKTVLTGNPFLPFTQDVPKEMRPLSIEKLPLLFVGGGSGGSHAVNMLILSILPELLEKFRVIHQCGDAKEFSDYDKLSEKRSTLPSETQKRYLVVKFIAPDVVNAVFKNCDVFIGRSGINTVATLLFLRKKAILIPLPLGQKNEQLQNAKLLDSEGLGIILDQKQISPKILFEQLEKIIKSKKSQKTKWEIPVVEKGAENLMKEVMLCASLRHQEN